MHPLELTNKCYNSDVIDISQVNPNHLWYIVGYIATDGSLSKDGRHVNITSKDRQILEDIVKAFEKNYTIGLKTNGRGQYSSYLQFSDVRFYRFLQQIGLTPNKSLTLGQLRVPNRFFVDFLRGVIDGDGSILVWRHASNRHFQWALRIVSASPFFLDWINREARLRFGTFGKIYTRQAKSEKHHPLHLLKFGKLAGQKILKRVYYPGCLTLQRKFEQAHRCLQSVNGWLNYKNIAGPGAVIGSQTGLKIR